MSEQADELVHAVLQRLPDGSLHGYCSGPAASESDTLDARVVRLFRDVSICAAGCHPDKARGRELARELLDVWSELRAAVGDPA